MLSVTFKYPANSSALIFALITLQRLSLLAPRRQRKCGARRSMIGAIVRCCWSASYFLIQSTIISCENCSVSAYSALAICAAVISMRMTLGHKGDCTCDKGMEDEDDPRFRMWTVILKWCDVTSTKSAMTSGPHHRLGEYIKVGVAVAQFLTQFSNHVSPRCSQRYQHTSHKGLRRRSRQQGQQRGRHRQKGLCSPLFCRILADNVLDSLVWRHRSLPQRSHAQQRPDRPDSQLCPRQLTRRR